MTFKELKKYTDEENIACIVLCQRDEDFQSEYKYHIGDDDYDDLEVYSFETILVKETECGDDTSITLLSRLKVWLWDK